VYALAVSAEADRCERYRRFKRLDAAYRAGDLAGVKAALGWPEGFPNSPQPMELASGDWPLVTAINLSPLRFIRQLLELGADPNFEALDGFPSLFVAIDSGRPDAADVLALLLRYGAHTEMRGLNDGTALHHAVARRDLAAVRLLLAHGADPHARTRIDDCSTPLEDAEAAGFSEAALAMRAR
jgi:ankyrin repeat protein